MTCNQSVNQSGSLWSRETAHRLWFQSIEIACWGGIFSDCCECTGCRLHTAELYVGWDCGSLHLATLLRSTPSTRQCNNEAVQLGGLILGWWLSSWPVNQKLKFSMSCWSSLWSSGFLDLHFGNHVLLMTSFNSPASERQSASLAADNRSSYLCICSSKDNCAFLETKWGRCLPITCFFHVGSFHMATMDKASFLWMLCFNQSMLQFMAFDILDSFICSWLWSLIIAVPENPCFDQRIPFWFRTSRQVTTLCVTVFTHLILNTWQWCGDQFIVTISTSPIQYTDGWNIWNWWTQHNTWHLLWTLGSHD